MCISQSTPEHKYSISSASKTVKQEAEERFRSSWCGEDFNSYCVRMASTGEYKELALLNTHADSMHSEYFEV